MTVARLPRPVLVATWQQDCYSLHCAEYTVPLLARSQEEVREIAKALNLVIHWWTA